MKAAVDNARPFAMPVVLGMLIAIVGIAPWSILARLNAGIRPDLPWAALTMGAFIVLYVAWLNGAGWPKAWRETRRYSLRLWRPTPSAWSREGLGPTALLVLLLAVLYMDRAGPIEPTPRS